MNSNNDDELLVIPEYFEVGVDLDSSENIIMRLGIQPRDGGPLISVRMEVGDAHNIGSNLLAHVSAIHGLRQRFEGKWSQLVAQVHEADALDGR
ncbi:hypothetical protein [Mycobacteroides abscessus]